MIFILNRTIKIENLSKRMSNYLSCITILTKLIGFDITNNGEKISLPREVEVDTLAQFKEYFSQLKSDKTNEMKMVENKEVEDVDTFWSCDHCTFHNAIGLTTCQMCGLPGNVCIVVSFSIVWL